MSSVGNSTLDTECSISVLGVNISLSSTTRRVLRESNIDVTCQSEPAPLDAGGTDVDCLLTTTGVVDAPSTNVRSGERGPPVILVIDDVSGCAASIEDAGGADYVRREDLRDRPSLVAQRIETVVAAHGSPRRFADGGAETPTVTKREFDNLRHIFEQAPDTILVHDAEGEILDANETAVETLGYTREELTSMNVSDIEVGIGQETLQTKWADSPTDELLTVDGEHRHADGTAHPVEVWVNQVTVEGKQRFVAVARDITERKRYEERLERQRDDLETLNQVVRHDIRNDLQLVDLYSDLLGEHVDEDGQPHLEKLKEGVENAVDLTRTARELAEVMLTTSVDQQTVRLDRVITTQAEETRESCRSASVIVDGTLPPVNVVGNEMLDSVFRNLLKNAIQHNNSEEPTVVVTTETADDIVTVGVLDDGPGVPDAQKDDIFGRGERGLESEGTGIGLYLVQSLVDSFGGDVWVEDAEDRTTPAEYTEGMDGAAFVVELPRAE